MNKYIKPNLVIKYLCLIMVFMCLKNHESRAMSFETQKEYVSKQLACLNSNLVSSSGIYYNLPSSNPVKVAYTSLNDYYLSTPYKNPTSKTLTQLFTQKTSDYNTLLSSLNTLITDLPALIEQIDEERKESLKKPLISEHLKDLNECVKVGTDGTLMYQITEIQKDIHNHSESLKVLFNLYQETLKIKTSDNNELIKKNEQIINILSHIRDMLQKESVFFNDQIIVLITQEIAKLQKENNALNGFTTEGIIKMGENGLVQALCYMMVLISTGIGRVIISLFVVAMGVGFLSGKVSFGSLISFATAIAITYGGVSLANLLSGNKYSCATIDEAKQEYMNNL